MLITEINTKATEKHVLKAARVILKKRNLSAFYEHGQWWVEHLPSGAQWAVEDSEGPGTAYGLCLEQVTEGEEGKV